MSVDQDDDNGRGQREKVKRVRQSLKLTLQFHPQLGIENRDMRSTKESNQLLSGQEKVGKARMRGSEESRQKPSRSFRARRK
jgi:hypothetical protein